MFQKQIQFVLIMTKLVVEFRGNGFLNVCPRTAHLLHIYVYINMGVPMPFLRNKDVAEIIVCFLSIFYRNLNHCLSLSTTEITRMPYGINHNT